MEEQVKELPFWITIASPLLSIFGAVWLSGYRVGKIKAEVDVTVLSLIKRQDTLDKELEDLADCIDIDDVKKEGYVTKEELLSGQALCKQEQDHRNAMIINQYTQLNTALLDHTRVLSTFTEEIKFLRETLIKNGIIK